MGIFQASKSYRDPAKSMTVKALEARLQAAQEQAQQASILDQPVADPMQGWAYLMNNLAGQANEQRAVVADINARDQLAKIKAGIDWKQGMTGEQYAEASRLDPEWADKTQQDWVNYRQDMEKQAKQNEFTTSEREGRQGFDALQQEDQQQSQLDLERERQRLDVEEQKRKEAAEVAEIGAKTEARKAEWAKLHPEDPDGKSAEGQAYILRDSAPPTGGFGGPAGMKAVNDMNAQVGQYDSALNNFNRALELTDQIPDELMGDAQLLISKALNSAGPLGVEGAMALIKQIPGLSEYTKNITPQQVQALLEYDRLVGLNAMTTMSQTLKGQSTDREMAAFLQRLAAGGMSREERKRVISNLKGAIIKDRDFTAAQLTSQGYKTDPYVDTTPAATTTTTTTRAPGTPSTKRPISELSDEELNAL